MSNSLDILNAQAFIATQLLKMQSEMDALSEGDTQSESDDESVGCSNVVNINTRVGHGSLPPHTIVDAALVTGSFEFRPTTQISRRMTFAEVDKSMDELEVVLEKLGVAIVFDDVQTVQLTA